MTAVKRGPGRPSEGERVDIRIPADILKRIDRDARRGDVSRAEQIRRIIVNNYNRAGNEPLIHGTVMDTGGQLVTIHVDSDVLEYPAVGAHVRLTKCPDPSRVTS